MGVGFDVKTHDQRIDVFVFVTPPNLLVLAEHFRARECFRMFDRFSRVLYPSSSRHVSAADELENFVGVVMVKFQSQFLGKLVNVYRLRQNGFEPVHVFFGRKFAVQDGKQIGRSVRSRLRRIQLFTERKDEVYRLLFSHLFFDEFAKLFFGGVPRPYEFAIGRKFDDDERWQIIDRDANGVVFFV